MKDKKSFVMYDTWIPLFENLDDQKAGQLIKAVCAFRNDPDAVPDDPVIGAMFSMIKAVMLEDNAKYEAKCAKNADNVSNRWEENTTVYDRTKKDTTVYDRTKTDTNYTDKDKDNDKDNDNEYPTDTKKRGRGKPFSPPTVEQVSDYCQERGNSVDPETFVDFYASKGWKVGNNPMKDWKACVRTWEKRDRGTSRASPKEPYSATSYLLNKIAEGGFK